MALIKFLEKIRFYYFRVKLKITMHKLSPNLLKKYCFKNIAGHESKAIFDFLDLFNRNANILPKFKLTVWNKVGN